MSDFSSDKIYKIEDGFNTNSLNCLLISLFFDKKIIYNSFLENDNIPVKFYYMQEIIKNLINNIKKYNIINSFSINFLKIQLYFNNFKDISTISDNSNIEDLYDFFFKIFGIKNIELINLKNKAIIDKLTYLTLDCDDFNTTMKILIKKNYSHKILNNIPNFIAFKINRLNNNMIIDIQKKITMNSIFNLESITNTSSTDNKNLIWHIFTIICFDEDTKKYFSYINQNNLWLKFDDLKQNSIVKVEIKNEEYIIKLKSVFLIYTLEL